ncbi:MAG: GldG family protein [Anaerolineales bacterium]|nr:GldG family protein [Anaerolineales bacterium]
MAIMAGKKKNPNAKYALIGLVVALLGCVSTGLLGAANALISMGMFTLENTNALTLALQISIAVLVLGLAIYAILSPDSIRRFFTGRQARYGSNSLILILAVLGIIFVANYIVFNNPKSWDLTQDKSNTLSNETLQILATLPEKVTATAFYSASLNTASADELLLKFKTNSNGKFDYSFVDPDTNPVAARQAGVTGDGKIMLQMGETKEIASFASEEEIARTMIRLISPEPRTVYFLQGHGEPNIESGGDLSYSIAKSTLESKNYTVNTLNLLSTKSIPEDALTVIIAGPTKPVSAQEVALLKKYVNEGGSLVVLQDPPFFTEFGDSPDPLGDYLTSDWGITLDDNIIIDYENTQNPFQALSSQYNSHPITQNLTNNYIVILPQASSVSAAAGTDTIVLTPLISTTDQSWGETQLETSADQFPTFDPATDTQGPLNLAVAGENTETKGRVVVFGNSLFATDQIFDAYGNGNIFINSVDWAAEQEDLLSIPIRETTQRAFLPPTQGRFLFLVVMVVFVVPGLVVFAGIYSWFTRRKRG